MGANGNESLPRDEDRPAGAGDKPVDAVADATAAAADTERQVEGVQRQAQDARAEQGDQAAAQLTEEPREQVLSERERRRAEQESRLSGTQKAQYETAKDYIAKLEENHDLDPQTKKAMQQIGDMFLHFMLLFNQMQNAFDAIPGRFLARLDTDADLKNANIKTPELLLRSVNEEGKVKSNEYALALAADEARLAALKAKGHESSSVNFVVEALYKAGLEDPEALKELEGIENAGMLAAKLKHSTYISGGETQNAYAHEGSYKAFTKNPIPYGAVIFFMVDTAANPQNDVEKYTGKVKTAAYSFGNGNFRYFNAATGKIEEFSISNPNGPVNSKNFLLGFTPTFTETTQLDPEVGAADPQGEGEATADEKPAEDGAPVVPAPAPATPPAPAPVPDPAPAPAPAPAVGNDDEGELANE